MTRKVNQHSFVDSEKTANNFIAFRVDPELAHIIDESVKSSGLSKTEWMIDAVASKLGMDTPEGRLNAAIDRLELLCAQVEEGCESTMEINTTEEGKYKSGSRVIAAADAALTSINSHFSAEIEKKEWYDLQKLQKAALQAALASIIS